MYSQQELDDAVAAGAITADSANALRAFISTQRSASIVDEEQFRLITGFNDIFVALASVILLVAVSWIGQVLGEGLNLVVSNDGPSPLGGAALAATAWGLATYFTAKRRMALPSIVLLIAFAIGVMWTSFTVLALPLPDDASDSVQGLVTAAAAAITAGGAWLHWKRFKVPITIAVGAAAVSGIVAALVAAAVGDALTNGQMETLMLTTVLVLGIGVFALAMRWDGSDPERVTRRSDVAFWLHLLAAPMIAHPVFNLLGLTDGNASIAEAFVVVGIYVALGIAALAIDRRALLVSGLAYVLYAIAELFEEFGAIGLNIALTALVIGSALLLLSAFWHQARHAVIGILPAGLTAKLPPLHSLTPPAVNHAPDA
ncbi:MAG: hypothetical protein HKO13_01790 [Sphingomonas sp.]|nr:hypothetical protein [Sphingomonas sp.]